MAFEYKFPKWSFVFIFLLAAALRLWYAVTLPMPTVEGDAIGRLAMANEWWYNTTHGIRDGQFTWLPLHLWIIDLPAWFGANIETGGRWMTVLFSLLTFPVLYLFVRNRFGQGVALISCFLLALNPFHIKYSFITMSEVPYLFFVFASLYTLYLFIESDKIIFLLLASVCVNCCNLIRFEAWLYAAILPFFLLYYRKGAGKFFLFGVLNSLTILAYVFISYRLTQHLVHGVFMSNMYVAHSLQGKTNLSAVIHSLSSGFVFCWWMLLFTAVGVFLGIKRRIELPLLVTGVLLIAIISFRILTYTNEPFWRYFAPGLFMLFPYAALSCYQLAKTQLYTAVALLVFTGVYLLAETAGQHRDLKNNPHLTDGFYEAAGWLKTNRKPGDKFICSLHEQDGDYIAFGLLSGAKVNEIYYPRNSRKYEDLTDTVFLRLINIPGYNYTVFKSGTEIDSILVKPTVQNELALRGRQLAPAFKSGQYLIYKLRKLAQ